MQDKKLTDGQKDLQVVEGKVSSMCFGYLLTIARGCHQNGHKHSLCIKRACKLLFSVFSFSDRLAKCIIYKPQLKLRAALHLQRPFMK